MADILQMHDLKPAPGANKDRIRVGRGEGSKGKTSGRGDKGTKKRYQVRPGFEGGQLPLYMRLPKLRGFKNPFKKEYQVVNVAVLAELFPQGGEITVADLVAKGAVRNGFPGEASFVCSQNAIMHGKTKNRRIMTKTPYR